MFNVLSEIININLYTNIYYLIKKFGENDYEI